MPIQSFDFKSWVLQQSGHYDLKEVDENHIQIETEFGIAEVNFYNLDNEPDVVELRITCKRTNTTKFFLHFQAVHPEHAQDLFNEMISSLLALKENQTVKVLLCCSAGMTTSFFAQKLNETAKIMEEDISFDAVSVNEVYLHVQENEAILVAPQVGYEASKLANNLPDKLILKIPTKIFASYDAVECITFVKKEISDYHKNKKIKKVKCECCNKEHVGKILTIATAPSTKETRIRYRVYEEGKIIEDREVIKKYLDLHDIDDIIDVEICRNTGTPFDAVCIALPGVVHDGKLDLPKTRGINLQGTVDNLFDIQKYFEDCVDIPVIVENNANCAAYGWYHSQEEYENICLMSQPTGWVIGGQGNVVNGRLVRGAHGIAGEIKYILECIQFNRPLHIHAYDASSMKEVISKAILANISILDPEVVVLRSDMFIDVKEIEEQLSKYLPKIRMPKIVHMQDFNEYVLLGQERLAVDLLKKGRRNE